MSQECDTQYDTQYKREMTAIKATIENGDMLGDIIDLLKEIRDSLKENRDNTKPGQIVIGPFMATSKEQDDPTLCNCVQSRMRNRGSTVPGFNCPVHGYQAG